LAINQAVKFMGLRNPTEYTHYHKSLVNIDNDQLPCSRNIIPYNFGIVVCDYNC